MLSSVAHPTAYPAMADRAPNSDVRAAKLFRNDRSQAVRIPADFEFPGNRVLIHKDGKRLVIEPEPRRGLLDVLRSLPALGPEDAFPDDRNAPLLAYKPVAL